MENITRIADLPTDTAARQNTNSYASNIPPTTISISNSKQSKIDGEVPTNYTPINVHPNPYGVSAQNPIMEIPSQSQDMMQQQQQQYMNNNHENIQMIHPEMEALQNMEQQRLPSRDIPQNTIQYSNDEATKPNYIPKAEIQSDYVKEHYDMTENNLKEYEQKIRQQNHWDSIFNDIQTPIFIAFLFFFFQLPIINSTIFKKFSFLSLYNEDGNFNMFGLILKSSIFGLLYYITHKFTTFISEL
jgi:hypothetical protein